MFRTCYHFIIYKSQFHVEISSSWFIVCDLEWQLLDLKLDPMSYSNSVTHFELTKKKHRQYQNPQFLILRVSMFLGSFIGYLRIRKCFCLRNSPLSKRRTSFRWIATDRFFGSLMALLHPFGVWLFLVSSNPSVFQGKNEKTKKTSP